MQTVFDDWPMFGLTSDVRPALAEALDAREPAVLVTLGAAESGAPFGAGAQMLITASNASGFLSGGCVEADVALHAAEALQDGRPRTLVYGQGGAPDIRLPCGGRVVMLLERIAPDDAAALRLIALGQARTPALWLSDGLCRRCIALDETPPRAFQPLLSDARGHVAMAAAGNRLARRFDPQQRLVVVGHDPIALALAELGLKLGWAVILLRPLGPEAPPPIAGLDYRRGEPGAELAQLGLDARTAVVLATHSGEQDHAAASAALRSSAGFVGLLGSRRRLPDRLGQLQADGVSTTALARLHAPVGLAIGAITPYEIAVSITAEIVRTARQAEAGLLWPLQEAVSA